MKAVDLTGKRFGKLTVLEEQGFYISSGGKKHRTWLCKCDCGNIKVIQGKKLREGRTKSCGCIRPYARFNQVREENNTLFLKVGDREVLIDKEDINKIYPNRVYIRESGYAFCGKRNRVHRLILDCPEGYQIDHINHNKLDNRKCNLRVVTQSENQMNRIITSNTGEFGISRHKDGTYVININQKYRGTTKTLEEAIAIRDKALIGTKQAELNYYLREGGSYD